MGNKSERRDRYSGSGDELHRYSPIAALLILGLASCASTPDIALVSPGVYEISRQDKAGVYSDADAMRVSVLHDANAFAASKGMVAVPITTRETPMYVTRFTQHRIPIQTRKSADLVRSAGRTRSQNRGPVNRT